MNFLPQCWVQVLMNIDILCIVKKFSLNALKLGPSCLEETAFGYVPAAAQLSYNASQSEQDIMNKTVLSEITYPQ